jgi:hypothetical protein
MRAFVASPAAEGMPEKFNVPLGKSNDVMNLVSSLESDIVEG